MDKKQSDKQTPKTFEYWCLYNIPESDFEIYGVDPLFENCWNAAIKTIRAEQDDKINSMQAEIDKRDKLLRCLLERGNVYTYTNGKMEYVINEEFYNIVKSEFKELKQRGEDK